MKGTVVIAIMALFAFAGAPVIASAKSIPHGHDTVVTGCLENGGSAGQYRLTAQDGTVWNVKDGQYEDLESYVGHTVTVAGPHVQRHGDDMTVLDVAVDSQSCQK